MSAKANRDVVFLTYNGLPDGDADDLLSLKLVAEGLAKSGCKTSVFDWQKISPSQLADCVVVLRSTWDYHQNPAQFLAWLSEVDRFASLQNSFDLISWNINKKYLLDLQKAGLAVVPTVYLPAAQAAVFEDRAWRKMSDFDAAHAVIAKPAIGLSTYGVKKFATIGGVDSRSCQGSGGCGLVEHVRQLGLGGDVLLQPYLKSVEDYGERSLIFIDGSFSHGVRKAAFQKMAAAGEAGETIIEATAEEVTFGLDTLSALRKVCAGAAPLYARVDVVRGKGDKLLLLELELIEPSLFLAMDASGQAPRRLAEAILAL